MPDLGSVGRRARRALVRGRWALADAIGVLRHGAAAPRRDELIWIDPATCRTALRSGLSTEVSGRVLPGDWDLDVRPVEEVTHIAQSLAHWRDGASWAEAGAYANMLGLIERRGGVHHGCRTYEDVVRRYEEADRVFERVRAEGRLRPRSELPRPGHREHGGILVHIGREGAPIYNGWAGCHRLAMAMVLALPVVPAWLGAVHTGALAHWRHVHPR